VCTGTLVADLEYDIHADEAAELEGIVANELPLDGGAFESWDEVELKFGIYKIFPG